MSLVCEPGPVPCPRPCSAEGKLRSRPPGPSSRPRLPVPHVVEVPAVEQQEDRGVRLMPRVLPRLRSRAACGRMPAKRLSWGVSSTCVPKAPSTEPQVPGSHSGAVCRG